MTRNVIVVGCARSGTSLVAGLFRKSGYHLGETLLPPDESNPRGFFEDVDTLAVNEDLLAPHTITLPHPRFMDGPLYNGVPRRGRRWMAVLPPDITITVTETVHARMRSTIAATPWCRKDPRFCYTLPAWESVVGDALRVCIFREPQRTVNSMLTWAETRNIGLTFAGGLELCAAAGISLTTDIPMPSPRSAPPQPPTGHSGQPSSGNTNHWSLG